MFGDTRQVDEVLNTYFTRRKGDLSYQALQEDQDQALLLAILLELREFNGESSMPGQAGGEEAEYTDRTGSVTEEWQQVDLGWPVADLLLYDFDEPIEVALADPDEGHRAIPLSAANAPTNFSPSNGLGTSKVWFRLQEEANNSIEMVLVGFA